MSCVPFGPFMASERLAVPFPPAPSILAVRWYLPCVRKWRTLLSSWRMALFCQYGSNKVEIDKSEPANPAAEVFCLRTSNNRPVFLIPSLARAIRDSARTPSSLLFATPSSTHCSGRQSMSTKLRPERSPNASPSLVESELKCSWGNHMPGVQTLTTILEAGFDSNSATIRLTVSSAFRPSTSTVVPSAQRTAIFCLPND
jgi:hypothetical protein